MYGQVSTFLFSYFVVHLQYAQDSDQNMYFLSTEHFVLTMIEQLQCSCTRI